MKTKIVISYNLRTFLKKKGVIRRFEQNTRTLTTWPNPSVEVTMWNAFAWRRSPEGEAFWSNLYARYDPINNNN